jgi:hypothetical protein
MPDWTWLIMAALLGAASALVVPLALLLYFIRPFEKKTPVVDEVCTPVTLPPVSMIQFFILLSALTISSQGRGRGVQMSTV